MKKKIFLSVIATFYLSMTACGLINNKKPSVVPGIQTSPVPRMDGLPENLASEIPTEEPITPEPTSTPTPVPISYQQVYRELLERFYSIVTEGGDDWDYGPGEIGVYEIVNYSSTFEAPLVVGYAIKDISGDGIPELIIGQTFVNNHTIPETNLVYAVFTSIDGEPTLTFEGWARNGYIYYGNGKFYNSGSTSAWERGHRFYTISRDGTELICDDYYFTKEKDETMQDINYYHAKDCQTGKENADVLDVTQEEFNQLLESLLPTPHRIELRRFTFYESTQSELNDQPAQVNIEWAQEARGDFASYHEFTADTSDYQVELLISTDKILKNFQFLSLTNTVVDETGKLLFDMETLYTLDSFSPEKPLVVNLTFFGDLPSYGFSYADETGATRYFSINLSGEDGSLLLNEF